MGSEGVPTSTIKPKSDYKIVAIPIPFASLQKLLVRLRLVKPSIAHSRVWNSRRPSLALSMRVERPAGWSLDHFLCPLSSERVQDPCALLHAGGHPITYIYIYIYIFMHVYIYVFISIYYCICKNKRMRWAPRVCLLALSNQKMNTR